MAQSDGVSLSVQINLENLQLFQCLLLHKQWKYVDQCNVKGGNFYLQGAQWAANKMWDFFPKNVGI